MLLAISGCSRSYPFQFTRSLPLIQQPPVQGWGLTGRGVGVAILDTGIDRDRGDFGCFPGGNCRIRHQADIAWPDIRDDDTQHGTVLALTVLAVAPEAHLVDLDIALNGSANGIAAVEALQWVVDHAAEHNIRVVLLGFGEGHSTKLCSSSFFSRNPFQEVVRKLREKNVLVIAPSGNEAVRPSGSFRNGIAMPACTPGVTPVGAVYRGLPGETVAGTNCKDAATAADQIPCFSQSSPDLRLLAPGGQFTANPLALGGGGVVSDGGTSLAAAHVAGAAAVLAAATNGTAYQIEGELWKYGARITDSRNGTVQSRIDLRATICAMKRIPNDHRAAAMKIDPRRDGIEFFTGCATKEQGEPDHAGSPGGRSVWFTWTAADDTIQRFRTAGGDTLLAVYEGSSTQPLVANDDAWRGSAMSEVSFDAKRGTTYAIAVDDKQNGGSFVLRWISGTDQVNDAFEWATPLSVSTVSGDAARASRQAGEPGQCHSAGRSLWYRWTAGLRGPGSGQLPNAHRIAVRVREPESNCVAVYRGATLETLELVAGSWLDHTRVAAEFTAAEGTTYHIAVESAPAGPFTLFFDHRILFTSNRDGNREIYSVFQDGQGLKRITNHPASDSQAEWSPSGTEIVFASDRDSADGRTDLYIMNHDGTDVGRMTIEPAMDANPSWAEVPFGIVGSPPYGGIAFESDRDGARRIWVMQRDRSVVRASRNPEEERYPSWNIYFAVPVFSVLQRRPGGWTDFDLHSTPASGPLPSHLTFGSPLNDLSHSVEPLSAAQPRRLALTMEARGLSTVVVNPATDHIVVGNGPRDRDPSWSPFFGRLVFTSERTGNADIFAVDADGANLVNVTNHPAEDTDAHWSPNKWHPLFR